MIDKPSDTVTWKTISDNTLPPWTIEVLACSGRLHKFKFVPASVDASPRPHLLNISNMPAGVRVACGYLESWTVLPLRLLRNGSWACGGLHRTLVLWSFTKNIEQPLSLPKYVWIFKTFSWSSSAKPQVLTFVDRLRARRRHQRRTRGMPLHSAGQRNFVWYGNS